MVEVCDDSDQFIDENIDGKDYISQNMQEYDSIEQMCLEYMEVRSTLSEVDLKARCLITWMAIQNQTKDGAMDLNVFLSSINELAISNVDISVYDKKIRNYLKKFSLHSEGISIGYCAESKLFVRAE